MSNRTAARPVPSGKVKDARPAGGPVVRRTQLERSEETRCRLLDAAIELLKRDGYGGFRASQVAGLAGVSRGAQTHHFPTKEALLEEAIAHLLKRVSERAFKHSQTVRPGEDVLGALMRDSLDCYLTEGFMVTLDLGADRKRSKFSNRIISMVSRHRSATEEAWIDILTASGRSRQEAEDILWLSFSLVRGLAVRTTWEKDEKRISHVLDLWQKIALTYFGQPADLAEASSALAKG